MFTSSSGMAFSPVEHCCARFRCPRSQDPIPATPSLETTHVGLVWLISSFVPYKFSPSLTGHNASMGSSIPARRGVSRPSPCSSLGVRGRSPGKKPGVDHGIQVGGMARWSSVCGRRHNSRWIRTHGQACMLYVVYLSLSFSIIVVSAMPKFMINIEC